MLTLEELETFTVRLPARRDFRWHGLGERLGQVLVTRVRSGEHVGYGETVPLADWAGPNGSPAGETPAIDEVVLHDLVAPAVLGRDAADLPAMRAAAREPIRGYPYAHGTLDIALHDLAARARGVPVHDLLGGRRRAVVPIAHMLGLMPVPDALSEAEAALAEGCRAFQVKGGPDPERDVELVVALRRLAPPEVVLRVDANGGYGGWKAALERVRALADAGATCVEEPVRGREGLRRVTGSSPIPVVADESCWSARDAFELAAGGAVDALSVYVAKAGGIADAHAVTTVAAAAGLPHDLNGSLEAGIGNAASLHVACASDAELWPCVLPLNGPADDPPTRTFGRYFEDDLITAGLTVVEGGVAVGDGPGLGLDVDEERLRAATVGSRRTSLEGVA